MSDLKRHKYRVSIIRVCRTDGEKEEPLSEYLDYHDLDYMQLVQLQDALLPLGPVIEKTVIAAGYEVAKEAGFDVPRPESRGKR